VVGFVKNLLTSPTKGYINIKLMPFSNPLHQGSKSKVQTFSDKIPVLNSCNDHMVLALQLSWLREEQKEKVQALNPQTKNLD